MLEHDLGSGIEVQDRTGAPMCCRLLRADDDIEEVTSILHEAYAPLAEAGMRYVASYQGSATTRDRAGKGPTVVALEQDRIVGVITLRKAGNTSGSPFYDRAAVAAFGQFAVRPTHQGRGIGHQLLVLIEQLAREAGVQELALDTSEHADRLIAMYEARGYRFVENARWGTVNYRSVILSKCLV